MRPSLCRRLHRLWKDWSGFLQIWKGRLFIMILKAMIIITNHRRLPKLDHDSSRGGVRPGSHVVLRVAYCAAGEGRGVSVRHLPARYEQARGFPRFQFSHLHSTLDSTRQLMTFLTVRSWRLCWFEFSYSSVPFLATWQFAFMHSRRVISDIVTGCHH